MTWVIVLGLLLAVAGVAALWVAADNLVGIHRELRRHNDLCKHAWAEAAGRDPYASRN